MRPDHPLILVFFLLSLPTGFSQIENCFLRFRSDGITAIEERKFDQAIKKFEAALVCKEIPEDHDIDEWMEKAKNGFIDAILEEQRICDSLRTIAEEAKQEAYIQKRFAEIEKERAILESKRSDSLRMLAQKKMKEAKAIAWAAKAQLVKDPDIALHLIINAYQLHPKSEEIQKVLNLLTADPGKDLFSVGFFADPNGISSAHFVPSENQIITLGLYGHLRIWSLDGKLVKELPDTGFRYLASSNFSDNAYVASVRKDNVVIIWNIITDEKLHINNGRDRITDLTFSPEGEYLLVGDESGKISYWNFQREMIRKLVVFEKGIQSLAFSSDGKYLMARSIDGEFKLFHYGEDLDLVFYKTWMEVKVFGLSPNHLFLAVGRKDGHVEIWTTEGVLLVEYPLHEDEINEVAFSSDGKYLITASDDGTAKLTLTTGTVIQTFPGHSWGVKNGSFLAEGAEILTAGADGTIRIWPRWDYLLDSGLVKPLTTEQKKLLGFEENDLARIKN